MEIEIRLPGPDEPFGPRRARPEDLGPDDLGNSGVLRATLEDEAKQATADFAELENARRKAEEEIGLERAGVEMTLERARLAALPEEDAEEDGEAEREDPLKTFTAFARERIAGLPEGAREDAALHAGRERLRLDRARRDARHNAQVAGLQRGVDESLDALTAQAGREPENLVELAERGLGLLEATGAGLRFDAEQQRAMRGRFGTALATTALRAMEPKRALAALQGSGLQSLVADEDTRAALTAELTAAEASQKRALKAETGALMRLHLEQLDRGEPGVPEIVRDVEIDFGAEEARAFNEQAEGARQRHLLRQQWQFAPEAEIAATLGQVEANGDPTAAQAVADEIRAARRRDPAAAVSEQPKLQALQAAAEEDPAQRGLAAGVSLELQTELGIPEGERRVLTRQGLSDLMGQIEAAPPAQRAPLLQQVKDSYGAHFEQVLSELETARLAPTSLALARRLDDPLAARRIGGVLDKSRAALTEGLDPAEVADVSAAARAAVPGALAPAAERLALDRYRQSGDQDDAVAVAQETLGVEGDERLAGGEGADDVAEARSGDGITFGPADVEDDTDAGDGEGLRGTTAGEAGRTRLMVGDFLRETAELDDDALRAQAEQAGLDPDVTLLFRDMLRVTDDNFDAVRDRLKSLFADRPEVSLLIQDDFDGFRFLDNQSIRDEVLRNWFHLARQGATEPGAEELVLGIMPTGRSRPPGLGARSGSTGRGDGRRREKSDSGSRKEQTPTAPQRQPGPVRRDDFETAEGWEIFQARRESGIPLGMTTKDQVVALNTGLDATLAKAGLPTGKIGLRGSAVTEHKFDKATGRYSDRRTTAPSDYDIAIVSSDLLRIAKKKGIKVMPNGRRSFAIEGDELRKLGLKDLIEDLADRLKTPDLTLMIYRDDESLTRRGAMMWLKQ